MQPTKLAPSAATFWVTMEVAPPLGGEKRWQGVELAEADWPIVSQVLVRVEGAPEGIDVRCNRQRGEYLVKHWRAASNGGNAGWVVPSSGAAAGRIRNIDDRWQWFADRVQSLGE